MHVTTPFLKLEAPTPPLSLRCALLVYRGAEQTVLMRAEPRWHGGTLTLTDARPVTDDLAARLLQTMRRGRERMTLVDPAAGAPASPTPIRPPGSLGPPLLSEALLVYHNRQHAVVLGARPRLHGGSLALTPPTPITEDGLQRLLQHLEAPPMALPDHPAVVGHSRHGVAWFVPAGGRRLLFQTGDPALNALSGGTFPQPALLMIVDRQRSLRVFALGGDERPRPATPLCIAPYFNVSADGLVCLGTTYTPGGEQALDVDAWTRALFSSHFTHPNGRALSQHGGTHAELWQAARAQGAFDPAWLRPTGRTLEETICGR